MALTKRQVDALRFDPRGPSQQILYDGKLAGFGVRVYTSGQKAFVVRYRAQGRLRLFTLGAYGPLTVDQARKRASRELNSVNGGGDPLAERERKRRGQTVAAAAALYLERYARVHKRSWAADRRRLDSYVLPKWGSRRLDGITRQDVAALHRDIGAKHPFEANRVLALLSVLFKVSEVEMNPAHGVKKFHEQSRDRWVTPTELPSLMDAIEAESNVYHRAAFMLYLLTGLRRSELLSLEWREVDLDQRTLNLRQTKANRPHRLPLSTPALALLANLPRQHDNAHVFPSAGVGHMADLKKPWQRVRERAGLADVRLHDLRRTVGSMMAQDGVSLQLIGKVLNHSQLSTTEVYARIADDAPRAALERHGAKIIDIATRRLAKRAVHDLPTPFTETR